MSRQTHADRILALLESKPLDDDQIARALFIEPRQTVNQICRRLATEGLLARERDHGGKIVNRIVGSTTHAMQSAARPPPAVFSRRNNTASMHFAGGSLMPPELAETMLIIPCSKTKQDLSELKEQGASIIENLPGDLGQELRYARARVTPKAHVDETTLVPAWWRYDGSLYRTSRQALFDLSRRGCHIVILSGGYGAVLASEPIGLYDAALKPGWWPGRILERVLIAYAIRHDLSCIRAFAAATTPYRVILDRIRWSEIGIDNALLLTPKAGSGAMHKSPASLGEALVAMRDEKLMADWRSSYGLPLEVRSTT